jgi:hypothetical protein
MMPHRVIQTLPGRIVLPNRIVRISVAVTGVDVAATSQGTNLDAEKVNIAWREALSLWSAVVPLAGPSHLNLHGDAEYEG